MIFTEIGYRSIAGAGVEPWEWLTEGVPSPHEQAVLYRAAVPELWTQRWLVGFYWWQWRTEPPRVRDPGFTPQGKPAEAVLRESYARQPHCRAAGCD